MVLPLFKLGSLAIRTLSKPIANRLKVAAGHHPKFRQHIINFAQANHRLTTTMQRKIYGRATNVEIRPLNEERAVQAAADLIGEAFLFSVAGAAIIFEVQRNARSEAKKEEARKQVIEQLRQHDSALAKELELLRAKVEELEQFRRESLLAGIFKSKSQNKDAKPAKPS